MRGLFFSLMIMVAVFTLPALANAPDAEPPPSPFEQEIPETYIQEALDIQLDCENRRIMSNYYNCECRALKYLEERVRYGDEKTAGIIRMEIQNECRDATQAAGAEYVECLKSFAQLDKTRDPGELCECFANTYSDLMDRFKVNVRTATIVDMRTRALQTCINPVAARQRYGSYLPPKE